MTRLDPKDPRGHLGQDDVRAAVAAGLISEAQAASVMALAQSRRGTRAQLTPGEEPFELFKGFNEIFIVVGLVILFAGWVGLTGASFLLNGADLGGGSTLYASLGMAASAGAAGYFTLRRRMVAPSIALVIMFALCGIQLGMSLGWTLKLALPERTAFTLGLTTLALGIYYVVFRVPFAMALIALGVFGTVGALLILGGAGFPSLEDLFKLSNDGPFAVLTIAMGLVGLAAALAFDMSDPHRVTRRASSGFWLHVISGPAIVNTVALTLFEAGTTVAQLVLVAFLALMALFAVVIDRRSFLVAGVGYVVALAIVVLEDGAMLAILILGLGLVLLGAKWERLRGWLMGVLPAFPGKSRLPPWGAEAL